MDWDLGFRGSFIISLLLPSTYEMKKLGSVCLTI